MSKDAELTQLEGDPVVEVVAAPGERAFDEGAADAAWETMKREKPQYYNAPILALKGVEGRTITAHHDEYKHHAVRDQVETGVELLSTTCLLSYADDDGIRRYLLGCRDMRTHRYGGMWEFGPAGALEFDDSASRLTSTQIIENARREASEEAGLDLSASLGRAVAIAYDRAVGSADIVVRFDMAQSKAPDTNWEYQSVTWASVPQLHEWAVARPSSLIPTAHALVRWICSSAYR